MRKMLIFTAAIACLCGASAANETVVQQTDKKFSVQSLKLKVGDTIVFLNNDPYVHNIFSLSDTQAFDLGTFGKGESRKVKLEKPGKVEIECAVHPEMKLTVEVGQ
jgi:plastocyanin